MSLDDVWEDYVADPAFATLRRPGIRLVPGRGQTSHPRAMLVGEAPGALENLHGRPFIGPWGILLGRMMQVAGLSWADVYATQVVKYWPPLDNGSHRPSEDVIVAGASYLRREYAAVQPDCIVAIGAVAHSVLVLIYAILRDQRPYTDLGADYFDRRDTARIERHHIRRLEQLGYTVTLTPSVA